MQERACGLTKSTVDTGERWKIIGKAHESRGSLRAASGASMFMRPTVVIAEDHLGCLENVSQLISRDYEIVAVATDGERGLSATLRARPDVVILDVSLPRMDGIATAKEIRKNGLECKILFLTVHEEPEFKEGAFRAGANGYVYKSLMAVDILTALKEVLAGRPFLSRNPNEP